MGECERNCPIAARVDALEGQLDEFQAQNSSSHKEIFGRLNSLERSEAVQEVHYTAIMSRLDKDIPNKLDALSAKIGAIEQKPAKRWEAVIASAISSVVTGAVVYLLSGGRIG